LFWIRCIPRQNHLISLCSAWRNSAVTFSFTWLLNPLHFNLFTIYANQYFRYVSCLSTEEWSHSARWLQAFAELVIFVLLTLKSHWRGRWTTSVNNICLYFYKKVYIFPRKWSCRFYVKCIFYDMGHVFPWKQPWEFVCELYFSIFLLRWVVYLLEKQGWYIFLENNHENVWTLIS